MSLRCDQCAEPAFAIAPGSADTWLLGMLVEHGTPMRCWCLAHWLIAHRAERAA